MNMLRLIPLLILLGLTVSFGAAATEVQPGVEYTGETTLEFPEYGASLLLPVGWIAVLPKDGQFLIMKRQHSEAYIFAGIEAMTIEEAQQVMSDTINIGDGVILHPQSTLRIEGSILTADYSVSGSPNPLVGRVMTIVGTYGWGISLLAVSGPQDAENLRHTLKTLSRSLSLVRPEPASVISPRENKGPWVAHLTGRKLSHFFTRSGYTEEDYIWLCPNGRFFKSFNSGGFGGGASGAFESKNAGVWTVSGSLAEGTLLLAYNDGSTARYSVTREGTKLFLDGKRYFRETTVCH